MNEFKDYFRVLLSLIILFYANFVLLANTTYYVSTSGNDANDGKTETTPWKTIKKVNAQISNLQPGDQILFKKGDIWKPTSSDLRSSDVLHFPLDLSGTSNQWIKIGAYGSGDGPTYNIGSGSYDSGDNPVIDMVNLRSVYHRVINFEGGNEYIIIENFRFNHNTNRENAGYIFFANDNTSKSFESKDIKFLYCEFDATNWLKFYYSKSHIKFDHTGDNIDNTEKHRNIEIGYCYFHDHPGEDMVNIGGRNNYIHHNIFINGNENAIDLWGGEDNRIEYNFSSGTMGYKITSQNAYNYRTIVKGNILIMTGHENIVTGQSQWGFMLHNLQDSKFYNNTLIGTAALHLRDNKDLLPYYLPCINNEFRNNIFAGASHIMQDDQNYDIIDENIFTNNIWSFGWQYLSNPNSTLVFFLRENEITVKTIGEDNFIADWRNRTDPSEMMVYDLDDLGLVNQYWTSPEEYGNFRITSISPAKNAGYMLSSYTEDIVGNQVPQGGAFDIGAFEFIEIDPGVVRPISLYRFAKGDETNIVYDISDFGVPEDLVIKDTNAVMWRNNDGLIVDSTTIIKSLTSSKKVTNYCKMTGEISIEAWIEPNNTEQNGPARIVSLSDGVQERNFSLGQGIPSGPADAYNVRLRTTKSTNNGAPSLSTDSGILNTELTHVVYTRNKNGVIKIYINTSEVNNSKLPGDFSNWDDDYQLILANEATGDRGWLGTFHKVAIYNIALNQGEINDLYEELNSPTDVEQNRFESDNLPQDYNLKQNYPNPFNPKTTIEFSLPQSSFVNLIIYNSLGEKIISLIDENLSAGNHKTYFDGTNLPSGIYFYRIESNGFSNTQKMILLK